MFFVRATITVTWLVPVDPGTENQAAGLATLMPFVCKSQPVCEAGQLRLSELPVIANEIFVGVVLMQGVPMTASEPSICNLFVHCNPAHGNGGSEPTIVRLVTG